MIKIGLIGIGGMGGVHFNVYKNLKDVQVTAVADVRTDMAKEKVDDDSINIYASLDELLASEKVDIIDICTPSYLHCELSIKALQHGVHVLSEKPMSLSAEDCEKIIAAAKQTDKFFMTAHVVRFMQPYVYLKSVIDSGELGNLVRLDMKRLSSIPLWSWDNWMRDISRSGGTPIDLSIHDIDFIQYVFGEPADVSGIYKKLSDNNDYIVSDLIYNNFTVSAEATWYNAEIPFEASYFAVFQNGFIKFRDGKVYKNDKEIDLNLENTETDTGINLSNTDGYAAEIEYFISCIKSNTRPQLVTPESSKASIKLAERILKAVKNV